MLASFWLDDSETIVTEWHGGKGRRRTLRPYVAKLHGLSHQYDYDREFLDSRKDYSDANCRRTRGIRLYWELEEGVYEVQEIRPRKGAKRFLIRVEAGDWREVEEEEVKLCLLANAVLGLMSALPPDSEWHGSLTRFLGSTSASAAERIPPSSCIS